MPGRLYTYVMYHKYIYNTFTSTQLISISGIFDFAAFHTVCHSSAFTHITASSGIQVIHNSYIMECAACGCDSTAIRKYSLPKHKEQRKRWLLALRNPADENVIVCAKHFVSLGPSLTPNDADFVPTLDMPGDTTVKWRDSLIVYKQHQEEADTGILNILFGLSMFIALHQYEKCAAHNGHIHCKFKLHNIMVTIWFYSFVCI